MGEILRVIKEVIADEEEFVVERVLDKRVGRTGKVIMLFIVYSGKRPVGS